MKKKIREVLESLKLKSPLVNRLIKLLRRKKLRRYTTEFEQRSKLSIFDIEELSRPIDIPCNPLSLIVENSLYGHDKVLSNVLKYLPKDTFSIEHGFIFSSLVQLTQIKSWSKTIVTYSDYRKKMLLAKTNKDVVCVGPFIHYADDLLSDHEFQLIKKELKSCLLVIPNHSTDDEDVTFESSEFLRYIERWQDDFRTVVVCMYWNDIQRGRARMYLERGFQVVTAGHSYDNYFLNRLKSIIKLSDIVISNAIGTHIGYVDFLGKPLVLYRQVVSSNLEEGGEPAEVDQWKMEDINEYDKVAARLYSVFSEKNFSEGTPDEDREYIKYLFGYDFVRINGNATR